MYISEFVLRNYKSFWTPTALNLAQGFNIIVGQNNAGKTALLEALSLEFHGRPHRSLTTVPSVGSPPEPRTRLEISFAASGREVADIVLLPESEFWIPLPTLETPFCRSIGYTQDDAPNAIRLKDWLLSAKRLDFRVCIEKASGEGGRSWMVARFPTFGSYEARGQVGARQFARYIVGPDRTVTIHFAGAPDGNDLGVQRVASALGSRIYSFQAQRFNVGVCGVGNNPVLAPDARNLGEVLAVLQPNPHRLRELNQLVSEVFPQIKWVASRPNPASGTQLEIVVWNHDPVSQRDDLAIPLSESGTGIGQVLAMLYVVLTSEYPRTIIIDEPQSFLHPGAIRKLIEILKRYPQHQFIVATHSPTVIAAADPATITMVRQEGPESVLQSIDARKAEDARVYLAEVGATLSDVFGADSVLWVEGATEEISFPKILQKVSGRSLMGTVVRGVRAPGDFDGRHAELVLDVYERLSGAGSLMPPAIGFIFDDEGRSEQKKKDLRHQGKDRVFFTARRMYESYLLNPAAIAAVVSTIQGFRETAVTEDEVRESLKKKETDRKYGSPPAGSPSEPWIHYANGYRVLKDLFSELSETRVHIKSRSIQSP